MALIQNGRLIDDSNHEAIVFSLLGVKSDNLIVTEVDRSFQRTKLFGMWRSQYGDWHWYAKKLDTSGEMLIGNYKSSYSIITTGQMPDSIEKFAISEFRKKWIIPEEDRLLIYGRSIHPGRGKIILSMIESGYLVKFMPLYDDFGKNRVFRAHTRGVFRRPNSTLLWVGRVFVDNYAFEALASIERNSKFGTLKIYKL